MRDAVDDHHSEIKKTGGFMDVKIKLVEEGGKALGMMPVFKTSGSACADSFARLAKRKFVWLKPILVPLGICLELPCNTEAIVRGRSGNGRKGLYVVHGTIDEDYRGEVSACVWSILPRFVKPGERIAQIAVRHIPKIFFEPCKTLSETVRGAGGFGSTGRF
jgi:dUTP pyrophosphatase